MTKAEEGSGEADLIVSEILEHLAAMKTWHFFYFLVFVTYSSALMAVRLSHEERLAACRAQ